MIELPEAMTIAEQMGRELRGKRIKSGMRGSAPHKFAFYSRPPEEYAAILAGKTVGEARASGSCILLPVEPDYMLVFGCGGERIRFHTETSTLPKKHHFLLEFGDGTYLTITVQGWGAALLLHRSELAAHPFVGEGRLSPLSEAFTWEHFRQLFGTLQESHATSIKYFVISKPGIWGVGNGYLQDILFRAKLHPRRRAAELSQKERRALYTTTKKVLQEAVKRAGRDTERDLYDRPGRYHRLLDSTQVGQPCSECGNPIEKIQYLGGACYFCPQCQPL